MADIQQLEQLFGTTFKEQPDLITLRQFEANNAYCLNEDGALIGLSACENDFEQIVLEDVALLSELEYLNLSDNNNLHRIEFRIPLPKLKHFDCSDSGVTRVKWPSGFKSLEWMDVSRNNLKAFVSGGTMPALQHLDLSGNDLREFKVAQLQKFPALRRLYLKANPLPDAKKKSVDDAGNCLSFLKEFRQSMVNSGSTTNEEYKLLLVGNGGVGKSCLVERLVYDSFEEKHISTHGVALEQLERSEELPYVLNIWDFGGQDIYHATHRMFLQSNAIYLALWDESTMPKYQPKTTILENQISRTYENFKLTYWLDYIAQLGGDSSVIVVKTKAESESKLKTHPEQQEIEKEYSATFQNLDFHQVDSYLKDATLNGFYQLKGLIRKAILKLNRDEELPKSWASIRQHLRNLQLQKVKAISLEDYIDIAADNEEEQAAMTILQNWLVPSGVVFYREGLFGDTVIINQSWAIEAVYTLFDRTRKNSSYYYFERNEGRFTGQDLLDIWNNHTDAECQLFLNFMLSADICYETTIKEDNKYPDFKDRAFVAPQLLPEEAPHALIRRFRAGNDLLYSQFRYRFFHYGLFQRFIIKTQQLAKVDGIWRNGILLHEEGAEALVQILKEGVIQIEIRKPGLKLLAKIRNLLNELKEGVVEEWVSLNNSQWVALEKLKNCKDALIAAEDWSIVKVAQLRVFVENRMQNEEFVLPESANESSSLMEQVAKEDLIKENPRISTFPTIIDFGEEPIKLLFLSANPPETDLVSCENEYNAIARSLRKVVQAGKIELLPRENCSLDEMMDAIEDEQPHIVHFCGHGQEADFSRQSGLYFFRNNKRGEHFVAAERLGEIFKNLKVVCPGLKMVFLNGCFTQPIAHLISGCGIHTFGTKEVIISEPAKRFAASFYRSLTKNQDLVKAVNSGFARATETELKENILFYFNGESLAL